MAVLAQLPRGHPLGSLALGAGREQGGCRLPAPGRLPHRHERPQHLLSAAGGAGVRRRGSEDSHPGCAALRAGTLAHWDHFPPRPPRL